MQALEEGAMDLLTWLLVALPVGGMVFLAGCGFLDMAERGWRRWQARRRRGAHVRP